MESEDKKAIRIRDVASGRTVALPPPLVATRQDAGTIMPPGLTATLTRDELRDLVRFLTERKGQSRPSEPAP